MASSPGDTLTDFRQTEADMDRTYNTGRKVRAHVPTVNEASIESIDGSAIDVPRTNNEPFASLRSQSQSGHNTPATPAFHNAAAYEPSSRLSDPTDLQSNTMRRKGEMNLMEKLVHNTLTATPKLNPATAEFKPATAKQSPAVSGNNTQIVHAQHQNDLPVVVSTTGVVNGSNNIQPQNGASTGFGTFQPQTGGFANMSTALQTQQYMPSTADFAKDGNNGMHGPSMMNYGGPIGNGVSQPAVAVNGTSAMALGFPNASFVDPRQQSQINGVSNGSGFQQPINGINGQNGMPHGTYTSNGVQQHPTGGINMSMGIPSGVPHRGVVQQTSNVVSDMPMANGPVQTAGYNSMNGAVDIHGSTQEQLQLSMNTLEAHISGAKTSQYPQAQSAMHATFAQAATGQSHSTHQFPQVQSQNGQVVQQQGMTTPIRNGQYTPAPAMFSPGASRFTPSQYLGSPAIQRKQGRTEPHNFAPRTSGSITNEPPPRFALQTPVPSNQQGYNNGVSPSSGGGDPFSPGGSGPVVNPFNGPALSHVIQPIEPAQNSVVLHDNPVPEHIRNMRSKQLNELTKGPTRLPSLEVALSTENFPFVDSARNAQPTNTYGVVKLKNIPFSTKRSEILAFLGRNSKILNDNQEPVHIIMERVTSKTNDAYVEFMSMQAAVTAVEKHQKTVASGRLSRLGERPIEVELSSQSALMKDLFPLAKGVRWEGAVPVILQDHPTQPWNCFKGFVTAEEMSMLVKHVEIPQRSPFSRDCPQRPFECMISTLRKFPWYKTECITIKQRYSVYNACIQLLRLLQHALREKKNEGHLTQQLFRRLWTSAMLCHGFTVVMKDNIAFQVELPEDRLREFNMPRFGNMWVHSYTLAPKPGTPLDVLEWYIALIREETQRTVGLQLPNIQARIHEEGALTCLYWGFYYKELNLPVGPDFDNMTLARMADLEFSCISHILSRALRT